MKNSRMLSNLIGKSYLIFGVFLCGIQILKGQNNSDLINNWDKIIIADTYGGWSNFDNRFQISKENFWLTPLGKPDSLIKKVDSKLVLELLKQIQKKNDTTSFKEPLLSFGRDSVWLTKNAEKLWKNYSNNWETTRETDSIAISIISDYKKVNYSASALKGSYKTDDYPLIMFSVIRENDTTSVYSYGQYPYMLPWNSKKGQIYNFNISKLIAELLPDKIPNNKERLNGTNFDSSLVKKIYEDFLRDKMNYLETKNKFPGVFKSLEKKFEITKAEIVDMSSIEWGGNFGRRCLEMSLKNLTTSKNIQFYVIYGVNDPFNSKKSILYKKDFLINSLKENPVYQYTLDCKTCLGEIHWVKSKSLSNEARKKFKEDLAENGIDKNKYENQYKGAVFYELTEERGSERSFSRWIFLKNGTAILWELKGKFLMNVSNDLLKKQGYICQEIQL